MKAFQGKFWIPAFAGMTSEKDRNDEWKSGNDEWKSWNDE